VGTRFSAPVQTGPGAHPASCTTGTGSFPEINCGRGVLLAIHPLLVLWSWNSRAIPLPTLTNIFIDLGLHVSIHYGIIIRPSLKHTDSLHKTIKTRIGIQTVHNNLCLWYTYLCCYCSTCIYVFIL